MNNLVEWEYTPCAIISQDGVTVLIESLLELVWYGKEVTSSQPLLEFYSNKCKSRKSSSIFTTMIFTTAIFQLVQEIFAIYKFLQYTIFQRRRKVQQSRWPVVMRCPPCTLPLSCTPVFWNCILVWRRTKRKISWPKKTTLKLKVTSLWLMKTILWLKKKLVIKNYAFVFRK